MCFGLNVTCSILYLNTVKQELNNEFEIESLTDLANEWNSIFVFLQANPSGLQNKTMHYFITAKGFKFFYLRNRSRK